MQEDPQPDNAAVKGQDLVAMILSTWNYILGAWKEIRNSAGDSAHTQSEDNTPKTQCHREPCAAAWTPFSRDTDLSKQGEWQFGNEEGDKLARILEERSQDAEKSHIMQGLTELFGPTIEIRLLDNQMDFKHVKTQQLACSGHRLRRARREARKTRSRVIVDYLTKHLTSHAIRGANDNEYDI
ncbi:hypothetical protein LTR41_012053 [Exophiala xenobiotica]|nr:hypothetical protein LTR41_012053 [Exophiala xenobiotica]